MNFGNVGSNGTSLTAEGVEMKCEIHAPHPVEDRSILIAKHDNKAWAAIYTMRGDTTRINSVRRAREKERDLYETEDFSQE